MVSIDAKSAPILKRLRLLQRRQLPYIIARTITELTKDGQEVVRKAARRRFDLKTNFVPSGIWVETARKTDVERGGEARGVIFTSPKVSPFMDIHEFGGTRKPSAAPSTRSRVKKRDKGRALTIPGKRLSRYKTTTKTGARRSGWTPGRLLQKYNDTPSTSRSRTTSGSRRGTRTAFVTESRRTGQAMIVRRRGKARRPLEVLYVFASRARIEPEWGAERSVRGMVNARWNRVFNRNFRKALNG